MNRIRIGAAITIMLGAIYASAGLLDSLTEFGIGLAVATLGVIVYGLCDFIEDHHMHTMSQGREAVWARRESGS